MQETYVKIGVISVNQSTSNKLQLTILMIFQEIGYTKKIRTDSPEFLLITVELI